jgi:hypothetical protein
MRPIRRKIMYFTFHHRHAVTGHLCGERREVEKLVNQSFYDIMKLTKSLMIVFCGGANDVGITPRWP